MTQQLHTSGAVAEWAGAGSSALLEYQCVLCVCMLTSLTAGAAADGQQESWHTLRCCTDAAQPSHELPLGRAAHDNRGLHTPLAPLTALLRPAGCAQSTSACSCCHALQPGEARVKRKAPHRLRHSSTGESPSSQCKHTSSNIRNWLSILDPLTMSCMLGVDQVKLGQCMHVC
jgi:hypothetical protein